MVTNNIGVPAKSEEEGAKHRSTATLLGYRLTNRTRAILEQTFELADSRRGKAGKVDYVEVLANQLCEDPLSFLERVARLLPTEAAPSSSAPGTLNLNQLFLQATQLANGHNAGGRIIDMGTIGVQQEPSDW